MLVRPASARHALFASFLGAACGLLGACSSTPIEIRDQGATQIDGRFLYRVHEGEMGEAWYGIELDLARVAGSGTQDLGVGEALVFEGANFFGPGEVAQDYELRRTSLGLVIGREYGPVSSRGVLGIGWQELELELTSPAQHVRGDDSWAGLLAALELLWAPAEWWGLDARAAWTGKSDSELRELELGAVLGPRAPLGLFVGWRRVDSYRYLDSESDIDLRLNGLVLGLRGSF